MSKSVVLGKRVSIMETKLNRIERTSIPFSLRNSKYLCWFAIFLLYFCIFGYEYQFNHCILFNFFNFYFYFILLYSTVLVLPYTDMNQLWVYMSSQSWISPSHLPPRIISLDHPRAPAPSIEWFLKLNSLFRDNCRFTCNWKK